MSCAMRAIAAPRVLAPRAAARPALRQQALQTRAMASAPSDSRMNIYTSELNANAKCLRSRAGGCPHTLTSSLTPCSLLLRRL